MTIIFLLSFSLLQSAEQQSITSAERLVKAMRDRYAKSWYKTVTFTQKTVNYHPNGSKEEATWYESMKIPAALRIEFAPLDSGNGIVFVRDSLFVFEQGKRKNARPLIHSLLLLGFDVYNLSTEETTAKLRKLNYNLSMFHEDVWQGRPAFVVGAKKGDGRSKQFWIDKERLVFVRSIDPNPRDSTIISEVQFNDYRKLGGGWIGAEVIFLRNGTRVTEEYYSDIKADVRLPDELFETDRWKK